MKSKIKMSLKKVIEREKKSSLLRLGIPQPPKPINYFKEEMLELLSLNPNNIGTTTRMNYASDSCRELENKFISKIGMWFGLKNADGYVDSGSTEGNIMAIWIGREFLKKYGKPIIVTHCESHYSIDKAARLLNLKIIKTNINDWNKPLDQNQLIQLTKKIKSPLIVIGTIGHTSTGTIDNIESISKFIKNYKYPCYLHLDAAIGGFFLPFLGNKSKFDFKIPEVKSITFDFHKYGFLYYPSGVFLCRKDLQECVSSKADYIKIFDDTLIGSRSGILPALMWANTEYLGKEGFKKRAISIINNKNKFIESLKRKGISYINEKNMPLISLILKERLPKKIEREYRIHSTKRKEGYSYAIYFYPEYNRNYEKLLKLI